MRTGFHLRGKRPQTRCDFLQAGLARSHRFVDFKQISLLRRPVSGQRSAVLRQSGCGEFREPIAGLMFIEIGRKVSTKAAQKAVIPTVQTAASRP